jgi:ribonuclease J
MKVTIHKGSHEIGGTCIQLSSGKTSILVGAGLPLSADSQPVDLSRLPVDALLVSHPHQDHFGLMASLRSCTPVYIGRLARSLIDATQVFLGRDTLFRGLSRPRKTTTGGFICIQRWPPLWSSLVG